MERLIDRYRLLEEVGSGGMAVVYRALDTSLGREVAIKVMHPHLAGREESRRRFSREARAVAKLRHPNIVEIWDFSGDDADEAFIVTELIRGRTLRAYGDEVGIGLPEIAALIVDALASALEHAHGQGVLHRDLKPENVMVSEAGELKLMDFGIARLIEGDEKMTLTGALVGSPLHMPPEMIEGRESDVRSDVFALGTIFYWLVTGKMAFQAKTTTLTLRQILEGTFEDPRVDCPACSDRLVETVTRCLRRDPAERFASMAELRMALAACFEHAGIDDPASALRSFFADPEGYEAALRSGLVARLTAEGETFLREGRTPPALACFDRVLALDPENEAVALQLERLRRRQERRRRLRRAGRATLVVALLLFLGYGGSRLFGTNDAAGPPSADAGSEPAVPVGAGSSASETGAYAALEPTPVDVAGPDDFPAVANGSRTAPLPGPALASAGDDVPVEPPGSAAPPRRVTIAWSPPGPGVRLEVDGVSRDTDRAPFWEGTLPVGRHVVHVSRDDCCDAEEQVIQVTAGDQELPPFRFALQPRPAILAIRSSRDDLAVSVDGEPRGLLRAFPGGRIPVPLATGSRRDYVKEVEVTLASTDGVQFTRSVTLRAGQESPVEVALE